MDIKNIEPKNRKYMREYKRRQYAEKGDLIRAKNKAYYYIYTSIPLNNNIIIIY